MKTIMNWRQNILNSLLLLLPCFLYAQPIKVFSRYNYYLPGNQISVVAALPDSISSNTYQLFVSYNGKQLKETSTISGRSCNGNDQSQWFADGYQPGTL